MIHNTGVHCRAGAQTEARKTGKGAGKGARGANSVILIEDTQVLRIVQSGLSQDDALAWAARFNADLRIPGGKMRYAAVLPEPIPQPISEAICRALAKSRSA